MYPHKRDSKMARRYYDTIDYLLEKFCIIFEKIIFGDSVIEKCNRTLDEADDAIYRKSKDKGSGK